jgi:hypothetical protein
MASWWKMRRYWRADKALHKDMPEDKKFLDTYDYLYQNDVEDVSLVLTIWTSQIERLTDKQSDPTLALPISTQPGQLVNQKGFHLLSYLGYKGSCGIRKDK